MCVLVFNRSATMSNSLKFMIFMHTSLSHLVYYFLYPIKNINQSMKYKVWF